MSKPLYPWIERIALQCHLSKKGVEIPGLKHFDKLSTSTWGLRPSTLRLAIRDFGQLSLPAIGFAGYFLSKKFGGKAVLVAMMSNSVTKGIYFGALARAYWKETAVRYGIWALAHLPLLL